MLYLRSVVVGFSLHILTSLSELVVGLDELESSSLLPIRCLYQRNFALKTFTV